jgi:uncharacterized membrane protein
MSDIEKTANDPGNKPKEPLFLRRQNGFGWDLNFNRPGSYWILAIILAFPFIVVICCFFLIKGK